MIEVQKISEVDFDVTVQSGSTTNHLVTLPVDYYTKLTAGNVTPEELIRKSFEFLLEREPNTSILRTFELSVIGLYFPEYEKEIARRL